MSKSVNSTQKSYDAEQVYFKNFLHRQCKPHNDSGQRQQTIFTLQLRFLNRPLRTRMMGGVGGAGEVPASTRLGCGRLGIDPTYGLTISGLEFNVEK